jgi:hypothetical protein
VTDTEALAKVARIIAAFTAEFPQVARARALSLSLSLSLNQSITPKS